MIILVDIECIDYSWVFERGWIGFRIDGLALKSARIVDFWGKLSGFADFETMVDRRSGVMVIKHVAIGSDVTIYVECVFS